jgi:hypothetical protein
VCRSARTASQRDRDGRESFKDGLLLRLAIPADADRQRSDRCEGSSNTGYKHLDISFKL